MIDLSEGFNIQQKPVAKVTLVTDDIAAGGEEPFEGEDAAEGEASVVNREALLGGTQLDGDKHYRIGIDCGSKTVKAVVLDDAGNLLYKSYLRHRTDIRSTLQRTLQEMAAKIGDIRACFSFTGSAGMQIAEDLNIPFIQEVVASKVAVQHLNPGTDAVIELGGEDSKILFITGGEELRMNSTCAGGTGGFIDTIAGMLGTNAAGLALAYPNRTTTRPIASRCAVFAQNDVRSLLNEGASRGDIAASTFMAVVNQCVSGLACGRKIQGKVVFLGGPLHYIKPLAECFREVLGLTEETGIVPKNAHLYVAMGAAYGAVGNSYTLMQLNSLVHGLDTGQDTLLHYLDPLFASEEEYRAFKHDHARYELPHALMWGTNGPLFVGIDSGSTTMKSVICDEYGNVLKTYYRKNDGDVITSARYLLRDLYQSMMMAHTAVGPDAYIAKVAVTGYGEGLLRQAFKFDCGLVETVAHMKAAQHVMPDVNFVLDIGGQDIKCIRIRDGRIDDISLNEACSSGCGALLSGFAHNMQMTDFAFAQSALQAENPIDLGMRCTVFMTSRVRHAQKAGASAGDISAGLAYSVVKNALYRVMNVHDVSELGEHIVVQGGTFKNDAVLRAFEKMLGRQVARTDYPELMGAYGAALFALEHHDGRPSTILNAFQASTVQVERESRRCTMCTNACLLTETSVSHSIDEACEYNPMIFVQKGVHSMGIDDTDKYREVSTRFIMGNRCTRPVVAAEEHIRGLELVDRQYSRVFRIDKPERREDAQEGALASGEHGLQRGERGAIGIPRALAMYEQFPFWQAFFGALGFKVVLSGKSSTELYRRGMGNVTSESTCYPAKLAHGHAMDLLNKGVRTVFYPRMRNEGDAIDCPVICDYAHILSMGVKNSGVEAAFISPRVGNALFDGECSAEDAAQLRSAMQAAGAAVGEDELAVACAAGARALREYYDDIAGYVDEARAYAREHGGWGIALVCRPYHLDPEINHGIPALLETSGMTPVTSDAIWAYCMREARAAGDAGCAGLVRGGSSAAHTTGWRVSDRQEQAVCWAVSTGEFEVISLYSFGCGIDVCLHDEMREMCRESRATFTALKVDDMTDISSTRIRVRSLLAALEERDRDGRRPHAAADGGDGAGAADGLCSENRPESACAPTLFLPNWMPVHMAFVRRVLEDAGCEVVPCVESTGIATGVSIASNDLCQTILSAVGQLSEYLNECAPAAPAARRQTDARAALVVPLACSSCCSRSIGRLAKSSVSGFGDDRLVLSFEDLAAGDGVREGLGDELAQALVAGDAVTQAACRAQALGDGRSFDEISRDLVSQVLEAAVEEEASDGLAAIALDAAVRMLQAHAPASDGGTGEECLACAAGDASGKRKHIAVVGNASLTLTPSLCNNAFDRIAFEGCETIPSSLATQAIHNARVEARSACDAQATSVREDSVPHKRAAALERFADGLAALQQEASGRLREAGIAYAGNLDYRRLQDVADGHGLDVGVNAGMGWCSQATMLSLLEAGFPDVMHAQTFTCLSSHVGGSATFKQVREVDPRANLASVEYDSGISQVNQINRIKLLAALAKERP